MLLNDTADYLTAKRQARQLTGRIEDIDAKLRRLQTAALPRTPTQEQMALLVDLCKRCCSLLRHVM